jgi:GxxExxY protein
MHENLTYKINGCIFKVYNTLGKIWSEEVYEKALQLELQAQGLQAECQKEFEVFYFGKRVGNYRIDILVQDTVIVELKAVPKIMPLHQAQIISYLKGYNKPIGILANFAGNMLYHRTFPNKLDQKTALIDRFDFTKLQLEEAEEIKDLLLIANRILTTLGVGYFHQIYRRAFYYELKNSGIEFEVKKEVTATYSEHILGSKPVNFFIIGDLLLSVVAVQEINKPILAKFDNYIKHLKCQRGLIFNFNAIKLDYRYL